jgi:hypothetical protein
MIGDMILMHELRGVFCRQDGRLVVALNTFSFRHMGIPLDDIDMALFTGHSSRYVLPVIEVPAFDFDVPFWLDMAGSTTPDGARNALLLPFWTSLIIVADDAVGLMNGEMRSLDQLGMAACASKFHPPPQLT